MMENRSFDHILGWLPGADGKQAGLTYVDAARRVARDVPARAGLPGLRARRSRPLVRRRARRVEQRRLRRLAARRQRRPLLDRLLPAAGPRRSSARRRRPGRRCDRYFASILGPTFPNRFYLARRRHRPARRLVQPRRPADDLGPARREEDPGALLLRQRQLPAPLEQQVRADHAHVLAVLRRRARRGSCPRSRSSTRICTFVDDGPAVGDLERRPSARRHPRRRVLPLDDLQRGDRAARRGRARCSSSRSTSGAASSTTCRRRPRPTSTRATSSAASACRACSSRRSRAAATSRTACTTTRRSSGSIEWRWGLDAAVGARRARDEPRRRRSTSLARNLAAPQIVVPRLVAGAACPVA